MWVLDAAAGAWLSGIDDILLFESRPLPLQSLIFVAGLGDCIGSQAAPIVHGRVYYLCTICVLRQGCCSAAIAMPPGVPRRVLERPEAL